MVLILFLSISDFVVDENALESLINLGFSRNHALKGLRETGNNLERAADWVFNHPDELNFELPMDTSSNSGNAGEPPPKVDETDFRKYLLFVNLRLTIS